MCLRYTWPLLLILFFVCACQQESSQQNHDIAIVPKPHEINLANDSFDLSYCSLAITGDFSEELEPQSRLLLRLESDQEVMTNCSQINLLHFVIDKNLAPEAYRLDIQKGKILIEGGDKRALQYGLVTLSQLQRENGSVPIGVISDSPEYDYRALMVDLSRNWHSPENLKQLIQLCGWYKIKYLQLHLTDDGLFTFPSSAFPNLASAKHYSKKDLVELNAFAKANAVILVPEIDIPGHSSGFIRADPHRWALEEEKANPYTLNMGKETVYAGLKVLLQEVADAFPDSPYIHIGGDEVFMGGFDKDPFVQTYMHENALKTNVDLYHHFIVRVANEVKNLNKQAIIWTGFEKESTVKIPKDILVMAWNMSTYTPQELIDEGYSIVNASWQPLYVVNNRKWSVEQIYNWTPLQWKGSATPSELRGHIIDSTELLVGGSMSAWEQGQYKELKSLRKRLAAMSEGLWNPGDKDIEDFSRRLSKTDARLDELLFPFQIDVDGLTYGDWDDANRYENLWFNDSLTIHAKVRNEELHLRYTINGALPTTKSEQFEKPILFTESQPLTIAAFNARGKQIGHPMEMKYFLSPITANIDGLINDLPPHSWENHKFGDSLTISFASALEGEIHYTLDGSTPSIESKQYVEPLKIKEQATVRAQLFDSRGQKIGIGWSEEYVLLGLETSLTTHKPVQTSHGDEEMGVPGIINDGQIARWDHWGAHTNGDNWVVVDLEEVKEIERFKTYTFWDGRRYYEYAIDVSLDANNWTEVVDRSQNREISTSKGSVDSIQPTKARFVRLRLLRNSANPGLHLVEFQAFERTD